LIVSLISKHQKQPFIALNIHTIEQLHQ